MLDDYFTGPGSILDVGPQTDGTSLIAQSAIMAQPADTAGGQPAQYGAGVLDIFKFGIGQLSAVAMQKNALDYKRYEATNGGLYQHGQNASVAAGATGGASNLTVLLIGAAVVFLLLSNKG